MQKITVYSPKGGAGKSTLAINLAGLYASDGSRVCVVDCDEQKTLTDMYSGKMGQRFIVQTTEPTSGFDVVIYDHHPTHKKIQLQGVVVCPIRPSRIDFESYLRGIHIIGNRPHILCVNQVSGRVTDDRFFVLQTKKQCKEHGIHFIDIAHRNIYKRATNDSKTVFDMGSAYGARDARKEITKLQGLINVIQSTNHV